MATDLHKQRHSPHHHRRRPPPSHAQLVDLWGTLEGLPGNILHSIEGGGAQSFPYGSGSGSGVTGHGSTGPVGAGSSAVSGAASDAIGAVTSPIAGITDAVKAIAQFFTEWLLNPGRLMKVIMGAILLILGASRLVKQMTGTGFGGHVSRLGEAAMLKGI